MSIFGGGSSNNDAKKSAKKQKKDEAAREARIQQGVSSINNTFAGFNDPFYAGYGNAYTGAMLPQLEDQYTKAKRRVLFDLANRGLIKSSAATQEQGDLGTEYATGQATIKSKAAQAVDALKADVENMRQSLTAQVQASADPDTAASLASTSAASLKAAAPPVDSLGNMFAELAQPITSYAQMRYGNQMLRGMPTIGPAGSSGRVVA